MGFILLSFACFTEHIEIAKYLLDNLKIDFDYAIVKEMAVRGKFEALKFLIEYAGAEITRVFGLDTINGSYNLNLIFDDCMRKYVIIKNKECEMLKCISSNNDDSINKVREYITNGISPNAHLAHITALMRACKSGNFEVVLTLISAGADINAKDKNGKSVLNYAAEGGNTKIMELLLAQGAKG
ncbi:ankyrin repeat domain-containing protein [Helicobacter sp. 23-1045]